MAPHNIVFTLNDGSVELLGWYWGNIPKTTTPTFRLALMPPLSLDPSKAPETHMTIDTVELKAHKLKSPIYPSTMAFSIVEAPKDLWDHEDWEKAGPGCRPYMVV